MKNTILVFILAAMSTTAFSQIQKGAGYFGGVLYGSSNNGEDPGSLSTSTNSYNSWNVNISYGHYLSDNFAIGLGAGISLSDSKYENSGDNNYYTSKQKSTLYHISPFIRTSKKISDNFYCFGELSLQVGSGTVENSNSSSFTETELVEGSQLSLGAGLRGGLNYFLNRHFALSLTYGSIAYVSKTTDYDYESGESDKITSDGLNLNLGLSSITVGLQYFINNPSEKK